VKRLGGGLPRGCERCGVWGIGGAGEVDVGNKGLDFRRDGDRGKQQTCGGIYAPGWPVRGVVCTWDVASKNRARGIGKEPMNTSEDIVAGPIPAAPFPPTLDDTPVVTENLESNSGGLSVEDGPNEHLEPDALGPTNIPVVVVPSW